MYSLSKWCYLILYISFRYDHPDILAGAGTMGLEILEQVKNVDAIIIPVGGGGLIAGVSVAVKKLSPSTLIIVSSKFGSYRGNVKI